MPFYRRILPVVAGCCPFLLEPQARNLALVIGALLARRSLCLTTLARSFPVPAVRQVAQPKHELLHRLKRLSRLLSNDQIDPVAIQAACIPAIVAKLGTPRWLGLTVDWTGFDVILPRLAGGGVRKYQVLTIGVPCRRRSLPLLSVTYERDKLPSQGSQNRWEEDALARVLAALPKGVRPVVLGDRGFGRAGLVEWLQARGVDYVLRVRRGAQITEADGRRWKLGEEGLRPGQQRWHPGVRYGTHHDRPRALVIGLACSWKRPRRARAKRAGKEHAEPWYLATSLHSLTAAVAWYRQRMWIEIVCPQVTKAGMGAGLGRRDHVADLHGAVCHHHPIDQQLDELAASLKGGLFQPSSQPGAEVDDRGGQRLDLDQTLAGAGDVALLRGRIVLALPQFRVLAPEGGQFKRSGEVGLQEPLPLPTEARLHAVERRLPAKQFLG